MTLAGYLLQLLILSAVLLTLARNQSAIIRFQILAWAIGVAFLAITLGIDGQNNFYSNDQQIFTEIVTSLRTQNFRSSMGGWGGWADEGLLAWVINGRLPFTIPAAIISTAGIEPGLALRTVSIVCLLELSRRILRHTSVQTTFCKLLVLATSACGGIGIFFSLLALRETMMMLCVFQFATTKSPVVRSTMLLLLMQLRPHLAISLFVAALLLKVIEAFRSFRSGSIPKGVLLVLSATILGSFLFEFGASAGSASHEIDVLKAIGIDSRHILANLAGLQFLSGDGAVLSVSDLILARALFPETVVVPILFIGFHVFSTNRIKSFDYFVLTAFCVYIGIAGRTDFNSLRQNLPLISLMGYSIVRHFASGCGSTFSRPQEQFRTSNLKQLS